MENLVSIITINFNNYTGLKDTVISVLDQTFTNYEYIIIDGNSTDKSVEYIKNIKKANTKYLIESDTGIYNAMNKGINLSSGKYILFLNSGDILASNNILDYFNTNQNNEDIIFGDLIVIDNHQSHYIKYPDELTFNQFYNKSIPHSGGSFIKSELFKKFGNYDENFKIVSDWKFFIETIVLNNCTYKHLSTSFAKFNLNGISSNESNLMQTERKTVLNSLIPKLILNDYRRFNSKEIDYNAETVYEEIQKNKLTSLVYNLNYKFAKIYNKLLKR